MRAAAPSPSPRPLRPATSTPRRPEATSARSSSPRLETPCEASGARAAPVGASGLVARQRLIADQRLAQREARRTTPGLTRAPSSTRGSERAHPAQPPAGAGGDLEEPLGRRAAQLELVDRLAGPVVLEAPVGGPRSAAAAAHVPVRPIAAGSSPRPPYQRCTPRRPAPRALGQAQREEGRRSACRRARQRMRRRARARAPAAPSASPARCTQRASRSARARPRTFQQQVCVGQMLTLTPRLGCRRAGERPLHGFSGTCRAWTASSPDAERHRPVALDLPGYGEQGGLLGPITSPDVSGTCSPTPHPRSRSAATGWRAPRAARRARGARAFGSCSSCSPGIDRRARRAPARRPRARRRAERVPSSGSSSAGAASRCPPGTPSGSASFRQGGRNDPLALAAVLRGSAQAR